MIVKCEVVISYLKYDKFKFVLFGSLEIEGEKNLQNEVSTTKCISFDFSFVVCSIGTQVTL